jgi:hypothetical protein
MITKETYKQMKVLITEFEKGNDNTIQYPYIKTEVVNLEIKYNKNYGDDRLCKCGHTYYRHFDTYDNMEVIGCKYCECSEFLEKIN